MLQKVELDSTLWNMLLQLATPEFDARQVDHALVIRATTRSTYNATMLRDKLIKSVARINGPLMFFFHFFVTCSMVIVLSGALVFQWLFKRRYRWSAVCGS